MSDFKSKLKASVEAPEPEDFKSKLKASADPGGQPADLGFREYVTGGGLAKDVVGEIPIFGAAKEALGLKERVEQFRSIEAGSASPEEEADFLQFYRDEFQRGNTFGTDVAKGILGSLGFGASIATGTIGAKAAVKVGRKAFVDALGEGAEETIEKVTGAIAKRKTTQVLAEGVGRTTAFGVVNQGVPNVLGQGGKADVGAYERAIAEARVRVDENGKVQVSGLPDVGDKLPVAMLDLAIEIVSEQAGGLLGAVFPKAAASLRKVMQEAGLNTPEAVKRGLNSMQLGNLLEEMFEERVGGALRGAAGSTEAFEGDFGTFSEEFLPQSGRELALEVATLVGTQAVARSVGAISNSIAEKVSQGPQTDTPDLGSGLGTTGPDGLQASGGSPGGQLPEGGAEQGAASPQSGESEGPAPVELEAQPVDVDRAFQRLSDLAGEEVAEDEPKRISQVQLRDGLAEVGIDLRFANIPEGANEDGVTAGPGVIVVDVNAGDRRLAELIVHERVHDLRLRDPALYEVMAALARDVAPERLDQVREQYENARSEGNTGDLAEEAVAGSAEDVAGFIVQALSSEEGARKLDALATENPGVFQRFIEFVLDILEKAGLSVGSEARQAAKEAGVYTAGSRDARQAAQLAQVVSAAFRTIDDSVRAQVAERDAAGAVTGAVSEPVTEEAAGSGARTLKTYAPKRYKAKGAGGATVKGPSKGKTADDVGDTEGGQRQPVVKAPAGTKTKDPKQSKKQSGGSGTAQARKKGKKKAAKKKAPSQKGSPIERLPLDGSVNTPLKLRKWGKEELGRTVKAGTPDAKQLDEWVDAAMTYQLGKAAQEIKDPLQLFDRAVEIADAAPKQGTRTGKSAKLQAYSTPPWLAVLASQRGGVFSGSLDGDVHDPTAGHGMLLAVPSGLGADFVSGNEIDGDRADRMVNALPGIGVTRNDATKASINNQVGLLLANPPFGTIPGRDRQPLWRGKSSEIGHVIVARALDSLPDNGRAVLILGSGHSPRSSEPTYGKGRNLVFWKQLYQKYNVVEHFTIDGKLYAKQGASWPIDVVTIHGRGSSTLESPIKRPPSILSTLAEVRDKVENYEDPVVSGGDRSPNDGGDVPVEGAKGRPGLVQPSPDTPAADDGGGGTGGPGKPADQPARRGGSPASARQGVGSTVDKDGTVGAGDGKREAAGSAGSGDGSGLAGRGDRAEPRGSGRSGQRESAGVGGPDPVASVGQADDIELDSILDEIEAEEFDAKTKRKKGPKAGPSKRKGSGLGSKPKAPKESRPSADEAFAGLRDIFNAEDPSAAAKKKPKPKKRRTPRARAGLLGALADIGGINITRDRTSESKDLAERLKDLTKGERSAGFGLPWVRTGKTGGLTVEEAQKQLASLGWPSDDAVGAPTVPFDTLVEWIESELGGNPIYHPSEVDRILERDQAVEAKAEKAQYTEEVDRRVADSGRTEEEVRAELDAEIQAAAGAGLNLNPWELDLFGARESEAGTQRPGTGEGEAKYAPPMFDVGQPGDLPGQASFLDDDTPFSVRRKRPEGFDESLYSKVRPFFESIAETIPGVKEAGALLRELVSALKKAGGFTRKSFQRMRPYLKEFAADWLGIDNVAEPVVYRPAPAKLDQPDADPEAQIPYAPRSRSYSVDTLIPRNQGAYVAEALERLEADVGPVDAFVAEKLEYGKDELLGYFSAEQIDALGLAIRNLDEGNGFIVGDQTGVGKGRFVAGLLRYGKIIGDVPIFVTAKPGLYADMYRDQYDIGGKDFKAVVTNRGMSKSKAVPLPARPGSDQKDGDELLGSLGGKDWEQAQADIAAGKLPDGYDAVFTTYDQLNPKKGVGSTPRQQLISSAAPNALFVLDESHLAGGPAKKATRSKGKTRAEYFRGLVGAASRVVYSSATFAKSANVLSLYSRTGLLDSVAGNTEALEEVLDVGGVPALQVASNMLSRSGQYVRREKSFSGIETRTVSMGVSDAQADGMSDAVRAIYDFDTLIDPLRKKFAADIAKKQELRVATDNAVGANSVSIIPFSSIMHNVVAQSILSLKIKAAADRIADSVEAGEVSIVTVSNTFESILSDFAGDNGLVSGDELDGFDFGLIFDRYLDRTMRVTLTDPISGKSKHKVIPERMLGGGLVAALKRARNAVAGSSLSSAPGSPLDQLTHLLQERGVRVGEITGRSSQVDYSGDVPVLGARDSSGAAGKRTMNAYNAGELDVLLVNRAGAAGFSLHASAKNPKAGQKPRVMFVLQPEQDINDFKQLLGRINRTGQVSLPRYEILSSGLPSEERFLTSLMSKLAGLNASTTSRRQDTQDFQATDVLNVYGRMAVVQLLEDRTDLQASLQVERTDPKALEKVLGRLSVLGASEQRRVVGALNETYREIEQHYASQGRSLIEAQVLPLNSITRRTFPLIPSRGEGVFKEGVTVEVLEVDRLKSPLTAIGSRELLLKMNAAESPSELSDAYDSQLSEWGPAIEADLGEAIAELKVKAQAEEENQDVAKAHKTRARIEAIETRAAALRAQLGALRPGATVRMVPLADESGETALYPTEALILRAQYRPRTQSALQWSNYQVHVLFADSATPMSFTHAGLSKGWRVDPITAEDWIVGVDAYNAKPKREQRFMLTGNLLAGYAVIAEKKSAQITFFTDSKGERRQGILMPESADEESLKAGAVRFYSAEEALDGDRRSIVAQDGSFTAFLTSSTALVRVPRRFQKQRLHHSGVSDEILEKFAASSGAEYKAMLDKGELRSLLEGPWSGPLLSVEESLSFAARRKKVDHPGQETAFGEGMRLAALPKDQRTAANRELVVHYGLPPQGRAEKVITAISDDFDRVSRFESFLGRRGRGVRKSVADAKRLAGGRIEYRLQKLVQRDFEAAKALMREHKISVGDAELYLTALHAKERNDYIAERDPEGPYGPGKKPASGMDELEASDVRRELEGKFGNGIHDLASLVRSVNRRTLALQVRYGLVSAELAQELRERYRNYVPLRSVDEGSQSVRVAARGYSIRGGEFKRASGRDSLSNPLTFTFVQAEQAIVRGEWNRVGQKFYELLQENEDLGLYSVKEARAGGHFDENGDFTDQIIDPDFELGNHVFGVKVKGEEVLLRINDRPLAAALKRLDGVELNILLKAARLPVRWIRATAIKYNPTFPIFNMMKDSVTAAVQVGGLMRVTASQRLRLVNPAAYGGVMRSVLLSELDKEDTSEWGETIREARTAGAFSGMFRIQGYRGTKAEFDALLSDVAGELKAGYTRRAAKAVSKLMDVYGSVFENSVRMQAYRIARENGLDTDKAAVVAKRVTIDFDQSGVLSPFIGAFYLFFSAGVNGARTMYDLTFAKNASTKQQRMLLASLAAGGFLSDLILSSLFPDDDEEIGYDDLPEYLRSTYYVLGMVNGEPIRLPMAYGLMTPWNWGRVASGLARGHQTPGSAASSLWTDLMNSWNPLGQDATVTTGLLPTAARPFVGATMNKKFHGGPIMPFRGPSDHKPQSERTWDSNKGDSFHRVAQALNRMTGGDERKPGWLSISPEMMRFWSGQIGGSAGQSVGRTVAAATGEGRGAKDVPILRRLYGANTDGETSSRFREVSVQMERIRKELREAGDDAAAARAVRAKFPRELALEKQYMSLKLSANKAGKRADAAANDKERREHLKQRAAIQRRFLRMAKGIFEFPD